MTLEEAKAIFEDGIAIKEQIPNLAQAYELASNALEKQIAKKPVGLKKNICPNCSWGIVMTTQKYCDECGQKLDR